MKLDAEAWDRIVSWIDLNVPDHGTWTEHVNGVRPVMQRRKEMFAKCANRTEDQEAIPPPSNKEPIQYVAPAPLAERKPQDLRVAGWPFDAAEWTLSNYQPQQDDWKNTSATTKQTDNMNTDTSNTNLSFAARIRDRVRLQVPALKLRLVCGLTAGLLGGNGSAGGETGTAPAPGRNAAAQNPAVVWESLPAIRTGVKIRSHTSKNAMNCTIMDWTNYTLQDGDGYEQAIVKGCAGMLVHSWFAWLSKPDGNLKLYLKDGITPAHDMPITDYFTAGKPPHLLWYNQDGCIWSAFPCLPFDSYFKAAITKRPDWYQYTLHLYREDRFSEGITPAALEVLKTRISAPGGAFPGAVPGNLTESRTLDLSASQAQVMFEAGQAGVIRSLRIAPPSAATGAMDSIHIRMTTDGAITADLPISMFFGGYQNIDMRNARGMPAGFDGKLLYCYFPMPFWKSLKIELVNKQNGPAQVACEVGWSDRNPYPEHSTGIFKVQFNDNVLVKAGDPDFANLDVAGAGTLVGCVSKLTGDIEGNFSIFTDGSNTPVIETTGGEDYFNHAYGIHPGIFNAFSGGLAGGTGYRFHILDYVPFLNSIKLTQDHAHGFTHDRDGTFLSAVYYYHTPQKFLVLTDSMDVGKPASEASHHYQVTGTEGKSRLQTDTASYEGNFNELITDEGRWTDKSSTFTIRINAGNDGVRLRKRINQMAYHQEVDVFVDGVRAGTWFEQGANYVLNYDHAPYQELVRTYFDQKKQEVPNWRNGTMPTKFRDTEFEIPAALTTGKQNLNIKMVTRNSLAVNPADEKLTNEYFYWIYSYAKAGSTP
ncbi:MAG: DUF2961 domain-containing protein [Verrucomicrobia bacterium]|nr:DUF2961 domain-containing protein [Verrucomicrobiota bacterium]